MWRRFHSLSPHIILMSRANAAYETAAQANARVLRDKDMWKKCATGHPERVGPFLACGVRRRSCGPLNEKLAIQSDGGDDFPGLDEEGGARQHRRNSETGAPAPLMQVDSGHQGLRESAVGRTFT